MLGALDIRGVRALMTVEGGVMSRQVVYGASSGLTDYAACFLGVGFSAFSSSSGSSRLMVM
jgi:hypothetical protein